MADELQYTDNGDGTITLLNDPAPEQIQIGRLLWEQMVTATLPWAVVTQDPDNTQHLTVTATNATATFDWLETLPGRITLMQTVTWA